MEPLSKAEYLRGLVELKGNHFFNEILERLDKDRTSTIANVIDAVPETIGQFLLREQMIGELRGYGRTRSLIEQNIASLQESTQSEPPEHTSNA